MTRDGTHDTTTDAPSLSAFHSTMLEMLKRIVDAEITRDVWDEDPPTLWCIARTSTPLGAPALKAFPMPLAAEIWQGMHGADVVTTLAEHLNPHLQDRPGVLAAAQRRLQAVAVCAEAWTLAIPAEATRAERAEAMEFGVRVGVADHPWGMEAKTIMAVSSDGWRYHVERRRKTGDGPATAEPPRGGLSGRYPDALDHLLTSMRTVRP